MTHSRRDYDHDDDDEFDDEESYYERSKLISDQFNALDYRPFRVHGDANGYTLQVTPDAQAMDEAKLIDHLKRSNICKDQPTRMPACWLLQSRKTPKEFVAALRKLPPSLRKFIEFPGDTRKRLESLEVSDYFASKEQKAVPVVAATAPKAN